MSSKRAIKSIVTRTALAGLDCMSRPKQNLEPSFQFVGAYQRPHPHHQSDNDNRPRFPWKEIGFVCILAASMGLFVTNIHGQGGEDSREVILQHAAYEFGLARGVSEGLAKCQ